MKILKNFDKINNLIQLSGYSKYLSNIIFNFDCMKHKNTLFSKDLLQYGSIIFGMGLFISLIAGFINLSATANQIVIATLAIFGIVIGFLNITNDETVKFLISTVALVILLQIFFTAIIPAFSLSQVSVTVIGKIFSNLIALIVPAAVIVSLKTIFMTAKDE